ncbi:hypothetical protein BH23GEM7_BH23GEM7_29650 [soil metagenome]|nr:Ig-like domain-containing protein [Gemmatimonadota bacterium]
MSVAPQAPELEPGQTLQFTATLHNPVGMVLPNRKIDWTTGDPAIATVNASGLVTAVAPGTVTVTASSGAAIGTATLTVNGQGGPPPNTAPQVGISAPTGGAVFSSISAIAFAGMASDAEDGDLGASIVWSAAPLSAPEAAQELGTGASLGARLGPGEYLVTARVTDSGGLTAVAQVGISV